MSKNSVIIIVFRGKKFDNHLINFILEKRRIRMKKLIILALIILALVMFVKVSVLADPSDTGCSILSIRIESQE